MPQNIGEMAERLKAHAWKACKGLHPSQVRILFSPLVEKPPSGVFFLSGENRNSLGDCFVGFEKVDRYFLS